MTLTSKTSVLASDQRAYTLSSLAWAGLPVVDACTVDADYGHLLVLTANGTLSGVDLDTGACTELCSVALPALPHAEPNRRSWSRYGLRAASDGRHAAIVVEGGREGIVVEVLTGRLTMRLDGGEYHEDTVPFSACFVPFQGRDVLVHRTEWNRLDAADPATGESFTERDMESVESEKVEERHLDYFHGQLWPSPDGSRLVDDGWVWHPVSVPRAWSASDWLSANPWESECGASAVNLTMRENWNTPVCWVGNRYVALWGLEKWDYMDEDEDAEPVQGTGVRILDVTESKQSSERRVVMDLDERQVSDIFSDGEYLYVAAVTGTTVWHIASGARIAELPDFVARLHHRRRGSLVAIRPEAIVELPLPRWETLS